MKLNLVTLSMLLAFRSVAIEANQPENLHIDAMLPARVVPSAEVLLLDGQTVYEFNVEKKKLGEAKNLSDYFKTIDFPVNSASFHRRTENETHDVFAIVFSKNKTLYYKFFGEQLADNEKILDVTDRLGTGEDFNRPQPKDLDQEIQGMAVDLRHIDKNCKLILCDGTLLYKASLPEGSIRLAEPPAKVILPSEQIQGCGALTMIKKDEDYYLLMATEKHLQSFKMEGGDLIYQNDTTLHIEKDILGKHDLFTFILIISLSIGIVLLLITNLTFGVLIYGRKKTAKVDIKDSVTATTETVSQKSYKLDL